MVIKDKRKDIVFLSGCSQRLNQIETDPEKIVYELCDWAIKRFDDYKSVDIFVELYQLLIELSQFIEKKEWNTRTAVQKKQHEHDLQNLVLLNLQGLLRGIRINVYIDKLSDRELFNEDQVGLYLLGPHNFSPLKQAEDEEIFRIYYAGKQLSKKGIEQYADLATTKQEILNYVKSCYPIDIFCYDRLFLSGKLNELKQKEYSIWMVGGSLAMCGLIEYDMPRLALNASVNVQDFAYTMVSCQRAMELQPKLETFIINMPYNFFSWKLTESSSSFDISELCRVDFPIFQDNLQYTGPLSPVFPKPLIKNAILHHICDLPVIRDTLYKEISKQLSKLTYYNPQFNPRRPNGAMLNYRFQDQTDEYNLYAAKTLADRHYANYDIKYNKKNAAQFLNFTHKMIASGKKMIYYVPPMTNFYRAGVGQDKKTSFYEIIAPFLNEGIIFEDYYDSDDFDNTCFQDYYHLNEKGAVILTKKLSELCSN